MSPLSPTQLPTPVRTSRAGVLLMRIAVVVIAVLGVAVPLTGLLAIAVPASQVHQVEGSFTAEIAGRTLAISSPDAGVHVRVRDGDDAPADGTVRVEYRAIGDGTHPQIEFSKGEDRTDVRAEPGGAVGSWGPDTEVTYCVSAATAEVMDLEIGSRGRTTDVEGSFGRVQAHSEYGTIAVTGRAALVEATSEGGNVRIDGTFDSMELRTRSGNIDADVTSSGGVQCRSESGSCALHFREAAQPADGVTAQTDSGDIDLSLPDPQRDPDMRFLPYDVHGRTRSGSLRVGIPSPNADEDHIDIEVASVSGDANVEYT